MNDYIKTDIENGIAYLRVGITNLINKALKGDKFTVDPPEDFPFYIMYKYLLRDDWNETVFIDYTVWSKDKKTIKISNDYKIIANE